MIVIACDRGPELRQSLAAILATGYPALELIVVDNAPAEASDIAGSFPGSTVISGAKDLGFARGNNLALGHARGQYIALIDSDLRIEPNWIEDLVSFLEVHPDAAAVGGKRYLSVEGRAPKGEVLHYSGYSLVDPNCNSSPRLDCPDDVREVVTLSGGAVMIRRHAIEEVREPFLEPLLSPQYAVADFLARTLRSGYRLYYWGRPACWQLGRGDKDQNCDNRSRIVFAYRQADDADLRRVLREMRGRALFARAKRPLSRLIPEDDAERAAREAWLWAKDNHTLLLEHRSRHSKIGRSYSALVRKIQGRTGYIDHERSEIAALIPDTARSIIDVGCASGGFGRGLKLQRPNVEVRGIEPVPIEADRARTVLDDVMIGGADVENLPSHWPKPDCVIFTDVLEQLADPWSTLRKWRERLAPDGAVVVSISNMVHHRVISDLVRGGGDFAQTGILDRTHMRFFTRATASELVERAGFRIERMERVIDMPSSAALAAALKAGIRDKRETEIETGRLERTTKTTLRDLCTLQYLILARADGKAGLGDKHQRVSASRIQAPQIRVLQVIAGTGWGGAERMGCTIHQLALEHGLDSRVEAPPLPEMIQGIEKELAVRLADPPGRSIGAWVARARARRKTFRPDVVHAHLSTPAFAATAWLIAGDVPLVLTFQLLPPQNKWARDYLVPMRCDRVLGLMSRHKTAHAYFGLSRSDVERLRRMFPDANVALAQNVPPRTPSGAPLPPRLSYPNGAVRLLSVGRLVSQKGFDRMMKALAHASLRGLAWHWIIVGDGEERAKLEAQCRKSGLSSSVTFFGAAPAHGLFEQADLVLSPSRYEGWPLVPMEALQARVPVVVSTIDPHMELLGGAEVSLLPVEEREWPRWLLPLLTDSAARARLRAAQEAACSADPYEAAWTACKQVYEQVIVG